MTRTNDSADELVFRFLSGSLSEDEERAALRRIAEDPDGRCLLKLELGLQQVLSFEGPASVPRDFAERTMAMIAERETESAPAGAGEAGIGRLLARWWSWWSGLRSLRVRPAYGLAVLLLAAAIGIGIGRLGLRGTGAGGTSAETGAEMRAQTDVAPQRGPVQTADAAGAPGLVSTRFVYVAENAASVAVAGDFNGWTPEPMRARSVNGHRVWTVTLPLREGEHQYMFLVDGEEWVTDPLAPVQREDGFGHRNAVIAL